MDLSEPCTERVVQRDMHRTAQVPVADLVSGYIAGRSVPSFVANQLKGYTSRWLRAEFAPLRSRLPTLWSRSFFVASAGAVSAATVRRYIDTQNERPWRKRSHQQSCAGAHRGTRRFGESSCQSHLGYWPGWAGRKPLRRVTCSWQATSSLGSRVPIEGMGLFTRERTLAMEAPMRRSGVVVLAIGLLFSPLASAAATGVPDSVVAAKSDHSIGGGGGSGSGGSPDGEQGCVKDAEQLLKQAKRAAQDERKIARESAKAKYRAAIAPHKAVRDAALADASNQAERDAALAAYEAVRAPFKAEFKAATKAADQARKAAGRKAKADFEAAKLVCKS